MDLKLCCQILTYHLEQLSLWILHKNVRWPCNDIQSDVAKEMNSIVTWIACCGNCAEFKFIEKKSKSMCLQIWKIQMCSLHYLLWESIFWYTKLWMNNEIVISGKCHVRQPRSNNYHHRTRMINICFSVLIFQKHGELWMTHRIGCTSRCFR